MWNFEWSESVARERERLGDEYELVLLGPVAPLGVEEPVRVALVKAGSGSEGRMADNAATVAAWPDGLPVMQVRFALR